MHSRKFGGATWVNLIVKEAPRIHPDVCETRIVAVYDSPRAPGKGIGRRLTEHVPDVRTRHNEQCASTHPYLRA